MGSLEKQNLKELTQHYRDKNDRKNNKKNIYMEQSFHKEDVTVATFYNEKGYFFLDVGAHDGKTISNTYLLEKKYGWTGICIEPTQKAFDVLQRNRNVLCVNKCAYSKSGLALSFLEYEDIDNKINRSLLSGLKDHSTIPKKFLTKKVKPLNIIKETITLSELLDQNNGPIFVAYMSLDTEGSELEILKGIDFNKYIIGYMDIEHNKKRQEKAIADFLISHGYIYRKRYLSDIDDGFVHKSLLEGSYTTQKNEIITLKFNNNTELSLISKAQISVCEFYPSKLEFVSPKNYPTGIGKFYYGYIAFDNNIKWTKN